MADKNIYVIATDSSSRKFQLYDLFPKMPVLITFLVSFILTQLSSNYIYRNDAANLKIGLNVVGHLFVGVSCFLATGFICWKYHGNELKAAFVVGKKKNE